MQYSIFLIDFMNMKFQALQELYKIELQRPPFDI